MNPTLKASSVGIIELNTARPFIEKWHYSGCVPTGKNIFLGWYAKIPESQGDLFGDTLYAVADYGLGINPQQAEFLSNQTGNEVSDGELLELRRLCRIDPACKLLPLTAFLSRCHKLLKQQGYRHIISFSDPTYGHNGGIYKAANFLHLGTTNAEFHTIDKDGNQVHRRRYYRYSRRKNIDVNQARKELGLQRVKTLPKDRWYLAL